jgi:hypothetical protein
MYGLARLRIMRKSLGAFGKLRVSEKYLILFLEDTDLSSVVF